MRSKREVRRRALLELLDRIPLPPQQQDTAGGNRALTALTPISPKPPPVWRPPSAARRSRS